MRTARFFFQKHLRNAVYSNVWIALGAALFAYQSARIMGEGDVYIAAFVGVATFFIYNFQRSVKLEQEGHYRAAGRNNWLLREAKTIKKLGIIGAAASFIMAFFLPIQDWILLAIPAVFSIFYALPMGWGKKKSKAFRQLPYLKIYLIAFTWMMSCVALPLVHEHAWDIFNYGAFWWLMGEGFLFILAITIPFDIRDLQYDAHSQKTIPQLFGRRGALYLAALFLLISSFCAFILWSSETIEFPVLLAFLGGNSYALALVVSTNSERKELFYSAYLDGSIIIKALAILICESYI